MAILANRVKKTSNFQTLNKIKEITKYRGITYLSIILTIYLLCFTAPPQIGRQLSQANGLLLAASNAVYNNTIYHVQTFFERIWYFQQLELANIKLQVKLAELEQKLATAELAIEENRQLKSILNFPPEAQNIVAARIVSFVINSFNKTILINQGSKAGLQINDIAQTPAGLIGRVIQVSDDYAKVLLLTDQNSRIPVMAVESKEAGILASNGRQLKMIYLKNDHLARVGELIYTSGDGKIFPRGIIIGKITKLMGQEALVQPTNDVKNFDFVTVVKSPLNVAFN